jgi:hypothetical protein
MTARQRPSGARGTARGTTTARQPATAPRGHHLTRNRNRKRDAGVAALEYLGMLPFLLLIALAGIQLGIVAYCAEQAGTAARTAARTAAEPDPHPDATAAGRGAVSAWVDPSIDFPPADEARAVKATATVRIPSVLPGVSIFGPVTRSATMPREDETP